MSKIKLRKQESKLSDSERIWVKFIKSNKSGFSSVDIRRASAVRHGENLPSKTIKIVDLYCTSSLKELITSCVLINVLIMN